MSKRLLVPLSVGAALFFCTIPVESPYADPGQYIRIYSSKSESIPRVVRLVYYLFGRGPSPQPVAFADNANCEGGVDVVDVVYLVNWALRSGPAPCDWFGWYRDPRDLEDAETIAMWESNELTASPDLVERVQTDLWRLRKLPGADQTALASLHFMPRWYPSMISIGVDSVTFFAMQRGDYHDWDSLNTAFGAQWGDFGTYGAPTVYFRRGTFSGIYNSPLLADLYKNLPGIVYASEELPYFSGQPYPNLVYPLLSGDTTTYLFSMAWSLQETMGRHRYWYCMAVPDSAWMVGDWDPTLQPEPWWWDQSLANVEHFWEE